MVLVHGTPWSSWTWRRVAPRLAERFGVYVFDLLGFGVFDQRRGQDVSFAGHGARLAALLEHWRRDRPALVAYDIGGATGLRAHCFITAASRSKITGGSSSSRPRSTRACCVLMSGRRGRGRWIPRWRTG